MNELTNYQATVVEIGRVKTKRRTNSPVSLRDIVGVFLGALLGLLTVGGW
jgi:hypothetical protein